MGAHCGLTGVRVCVVSADERVPIPAAIPRDDVFGVDANVHVTRNATARVRAG